MSQVFLRGEGKLSVDYVGTLKIVSDLLVISRILRTNNDQRVIARKQD